MSRPQDQRKHFRYQNRRGDLLYIHSGKNGRPALRKSPDGSLAELPHGYEIREDIHGRTSVVPRHTRVIAETEERLVRRALEEVRPRDAYTLELSGRAMTVFASARDGRCFTDSLDAEFSLGFAHALEEVFERRYGHELAGLFHAAQRRRQKESRKERYYPLLRFELTDVVNRLFWVKRIYFSGDQDWLPLERLPLAAAVAKYMPHLGRDSFFDLL